MALGGRTWDEWIAQYATSHQHPVNRVCHTIGIPLIAASIPLFLASIWMPGFWRIPLALFVVGWTFQFIGHAFEGKPLTISKTGEVVSAVYGFALMLLKVINELKPTCYAIAFDKKGLTFRHEPSPSQRSRKAGNSLPPCRSGLSRTPSCPRPDRQWCGN